MKFGANLWIWDSPVSVDVIRQRAPHLASWGFDIIEIPFETKTSWDAHEVHDILDTYGLRPAVCIAMSPERDLTTNDPQIVQSTQTYLQRAIEAAAAIGATCIAGPMYAPTGRTGVIGNHERQAILHRLAEHLQPILITAHEAGIRLAIEPLNRFETSLFNTVGQTLELIDLVADDALGLLLDTFHMNIEERDMIDAFRQSGTHLMHVHACGNDRGAPGNGTMPWAAIAKVLRDIGYGGSDSDGAIVIESFAGNNQVIAKAASIWRPLAPSQDAIATEGLRFLRNVFQDEQIA